MSAGDLYAVSYGDWIELRKAQKPPIASSHDAIVTEKTLRYSARNPEWNETDPNSEFWIIKAKKLKTVHPNLCVTGGRVLRSVKASDFYRLVGARLKKGTVMKLTAQQVSVLEGGQ